MMRWIWISFVFGLCVSLIWWPGMTTYEAIAQIIEEERFWVSHIFESTLLTWIDQAITVILHFVTGTPLPDGITSSVQYQEGLGDNGVWVPAERVDELAEKICFVAENYSSLKHLEESNRSRVEQNFTWDTVAKRYVEYISSL